LTPLVRLIADLARGHGFADVGSALLVTPRDATSNCVVALVLDPRSAEPMLVAKIARLPEAEQAIVHEAETLRAIQNRRLTATVPAVVGLDQLKDSLMLIETALVGETIRPDDLRRRRQHWVDEVLLWLLDLSAPATGRADFDQLVEAPLQRFAAALPPEGREVALVERTLEALAPLRAAPAPAVVEHGDLSHPNLIRLRDGRIGVVDWELARPAGLPANDLCFFLGYVALISRRAHTARRQAAAFDEAFAAPDGWARRPLLAYARRMEIELGLLTPLLVATWARYSARLVGRVEGHPLGLQRKTSSRLAPETLAAVRGSPYWTLWERSLDLAPRLNWFE
jgi:aminoglycoside phosphotransferase (APT) family kinase protein